MADSSAGVASDEDWVPLEPLEGPEGMNGMNPIDFWDTSNQAALRTLGGGALLVAGGDLIASSLLNTAGGRSVLSYAIRCALSADTTVSTASGVAFDGELGLATAWSARALTTAEQRWTTACLLQHLNAYNKDVPMMLEGSHPALDPRPGEDLSDFTLEDTTAFGNLFVPAHLATAYVCVDSGVQLHCGAEFGTYARERLCGASPTCAVTMLGACMSHCTDDAFGDPTCMDGAYPEAISTQLDEAGLGERYPDCG